jgi:serine/threonine-protein kinase
VTDDRRSSDDSDGLAVTELAETQPYAAGRAVSGTRSSTAGSHARAVGRFRIQAQLGAGGMGDVFRAHDPVLDRSVALKVLRAESGADGAQRMRRVVREARAAAALTHPNTVTIFEVGESDEEVFIAMELLEGEDLRAVLDRGDATLEQKLRWLLHAARALAAAHERGLVHRDVKPENMFICKDGTLKLLDFGIAKRDEDEHIAGDAVEASMGPSSLRTEAGRRIGTPRYMAPEQRAGEATDARTDEYAWGLVAYELITGTDGVGTLPTTGGEGEPLPESGRVKIDELRAKAPDLAEPIASAIARSLEPVKENRFSSMDEIVSIFEVASAPPVVTPPEPSAPSGDPPAKPTRPAWHAGLALAAAAGLIVGAVLVLRSKSVQHARTTESALPPACRLVSSNVVKVAPKDRIAVLYDRSVAIARVGENGLAFERETPTGMVPILDSPVIKPMLKLPYARVDLATGREGALPALIIVLFNNGPHGATILRWAPDNSVRARHVEGSVAEIAATTCRDGIVALSVTHEMSTNGTLEPGRVETHLIGAPEHERRFTIAMMEARYPSIAGSKDRIAAAYSTRSGLELAMVGNDLERQGDVMTLSPTDGSPAAAFAGETATVFWTQDHAGKTRLTYASFTPGDTTFVPPKIALDEPLGPYGPLTVQLPNGAWAVAWIASRGGPATLRVSPIGKLGALTGPTDIAKAPEIRGMMAWSTDAGLALSYYENDDEIRISHVACNPP